MGASVRIEDEAFSCERYEDLATAAGLADADHARGKMARIWRQCTLETRHILPVATITRILGPRGVEALVEARLGEVVDGGVRICGTKGRVEWLKKLRKNRKFGKLGGRPKKNPNGLSDKATKVSGGADPKTLLTPTPVLTPTPTPTKSEERESAAQAPLAPSLLDVEQAVQRNLGDIGTQRARSRKPKPSEPTAPERAVVARVLEKLSAQNGVRYSGADEHTRLIVNQLRAGVTEMDLRAVVGYCALELDWKDDDKMRKHLTPDTLFGPRTIHRYLDPARTWFARLPADNPAPPQAADPFDEPDWMRGGVA